MKAIPKPRFKVSRRLYKIRSGQVSGDTAPCFTRPRPARPAAAPIDASSSGNFYFYGALTTPKTMNNCDAPPSSAAGALDFALA